MSMSGPGAVQLDETYAHQVAAGFLDAPSEPQDPFTATAYRLLELQTDQLFCGLTRPGAARSVRVAFTRCRAPYGSDAEMIAAVRATRVLEVVTARVDLDRPHPLLGNEPGGAYDRFRAVHDLVGHVRLGHGFDRHGEFAAWLEQESLYRGLARRALATELHGEHSVLWTTGVLAEHKATLIATQVVLRARRGSLGTRA
jgi:hypothetical protein